MGVMLGYELSLRGFRCISDASYNIMGQCTGPQGCKGVGSEIGVLEVV